MNTQITWEQIFDITAGLIKEIKDSGKEYDYILTLPKGGLMPSYFFAEALDIPVETINVQSYVGQERRELTLRGQVGFSKEIQEGERVLVIDDIYDSGETMKYIKTAYPSVDTLALFARYRDHDLTYAGHVLDHKEYIDFPWEGQIKL